MKPRLVVQPGYITSATDGDKHFVSAGRLLQLYSIDKPYPWDDLIVVQVNRHQSYTPQVGDVRLTPDPSGKYKIPNPLTRRDINEIKRYNSSR